MSTSQERTKGLPPGRVIHDAGHWRVIQDTLNLQWHVAQRGHRDRGVTHWHTAFSTLQRNELAGYLARTYDLPRSVERMLISMPYLMQSDAGKDDRPEDPGQAIRKSSPSPAVTRSTPPAANINRSDHRPLTARLGRSILTAWAGGAA